ncbi:crotonase/enoyl-CoA hydratase family protein [Breoghania sp. L-A4]|uniref:crotonase/enoyl-CoA hydratase family protein n=1 Tax=Breoghania sp. L-A4 TaxID=2304600 RepID=UPI000E35ECED|nr:crotonase/enoyl-CoA hydratase family protein [Breoghania sp. L-A4]AXS40609.1 crotonase/enoyl-CoA hydratase family protein [Breoghania sp. L-A4]
MSIAVERDGAVTIITIDRPEARNAVDPDTAEALSEAFLRFNADDDARVAVLTGAGGAFCAGFDLKYAGSLEQERRPLGDLDIPAGWHGGNGSDIPRGPMGPTRLTLDKPLLAAISGPAVAGGMELALLADMRVMEETAYMGVFCRRWGVPLIDGGTVRLPRLVGMGRAMDLILTGRKIMADECQRIGLAERIVPHGDALSAARALAAEIARFPPECVRADRKAAYAAWGKPINEALSIEWASRSILQKEGISGAQRFARGAGRSGDFERI